MPFVSLEGRKLFYREAGAGRPVLLLHGFPFTHESFWPQLDAPPAGLRLLAPDHRGFGQSEPGPGPSTMEALASDALALLDALGLARATVGGVSMGGYVSLALARLAPERVEALLLLDTQASADDDAGRQRREAAARDAETGGMAPIARAMLPRLFAPGAPADPVARIDRIMRENSSAATAAASRGMGERADTMAVLRGLAVPCLVVVGELDAITPPEKARAMAEAAQGARLEVIAGAGHLAHLERPEQVNAILAEFLLGSR